MSVIIHGNIVEEVFDYEKLLQKATQRFKRKADVSSQRIFDWFHELQWTEYIRYNILENLMFKLRQDLWNSLEN